MYGRIYGLHDPVTGELRYIGQTIHSIQRRLQTHLCPSVLAHKKAVTCWIQSLLKQGLRPEPRLRAEAFSADELDALEIQHIAEAKLAGHRLLNLTEGGLGPRGRKLTPEHIQKLRSPEAIAKQRARKIGKKLSDEHKAKISASLVGKDQSHFTRYSGEAHSQFRDDISTGYILKRLGEGAFKAEIARELGVAHTFVHRRVAQAKKAGLTDGRRAKKVGT